MLSKDLNSSRPCFRRSPAEIKNTKNKQNEREGRTGILVKNLLKEEKMERISWPSNNVVQGGAFHQRHVNYSPATHDMIKSKILLYYKVTY